MTFSHKLSGLGILAVLGVGWFVATEDTDNRPLGAQPSLIIPDLTAQHAMGRDLFDVNCAVCHGENAAGTDQGPPLVHRIYEPSHHGDMSFVLAVRNGVRAHHWQFGNMPAIEDVTDDDVAQITGYIRALQRANGID